MSNHRYVNIYWEHDLPVALIGAVIPLLTSIHCSNGQYNYMFSWPWAYGGEDFHFYLNFPVPATQTWYAKVHKMGGYAIKGNNGSTYYIYVNPANSRFHTKSSHECDIYMKLTWTGVI